MGEKRSSNTEQPMLKTLLLLSILSVGVLSVCPSTLSPNLPVITGKKLDAIQLRQKREGSFYSDFNSDGSCTQYWNKMTELNAEMEKHSCWLGDTYESIVSNSPSDNLADLLDIIRRVQDKLGENTSEDFYLEKLEVLGEKFSSMTTEILHSANSEERFTSEAELAAATDDIETSVAGDVQTNLGLVSEVDNIILQRIRDIIGTTVGGSVSDEVAQALTALKEQVQTSAQDIEAAEISSSAERELQVQFYLSLCTGTGAKPLTPLLKLVPELNEAITLVESLKDKAQAQGYAIGSSYANYLRRAKQYRDSSNASYRLAALKYLALAYQSIGAGQYAYSSC